MINSPSRKDLDWKCWGIPVLFCTNMPGFSEILQTAISHVRFRVFLPFKAPGFTIWHDSFFFFQKKIDISNDGSHPFLPFHLLFQTAMCYLWHNAVMYTLISGKLPWIWLLPCLNTFEMMYEIGMVCTSFARHPIWKCPYQRAIHNPFRWPWWVRRQRWQLYQYG